MSQLLTCLVVVLLLCSSRAAAQAVDSEPLAVTVSADRHLSIDTGADVTFAAASGAASLEDRVLSRLKLKDRPRVGLPARIALTVFLDHPVAIFLVVFDHEAYGHGGRAREFGARASVRLGSPWKFDPLFKGGTRFGGGAVWDRELPLDDQLQVYTGGVEANTRSATIVERELVAGSAARGTQLLYFIRSRSYASYYVLSHTPDPSRDPGRFYDEWSGGGDVARYLGYLNTKYYGENGVTPLSSSPTVQAEYRRLRWQAWINAADPGTYLAAWTLVRQIATGDARTSLPLPSIAGRRVLPILAADWTPDGGSISLETVFSRKIGQTAGPRWFSIIVRNGNGPGGRFWSAGGATEMLAALKDFRIGGEAEVWNQPSYGAGGGAYLRTVATQGQLRGLLFDLGVKTKGHWPGRPVASGLILRAGYRFAY